MKAVHSIAYRLRELNDERRPLVLLATLLGFFAPSVWIWGPQVIVQFFKACWPLVIGMFGLKHGDDSIGLVFLFGVPGAFVGAILGVCLGSIINVLLSMRQHP